MQDSLKNETGSHHPEVTQAVTLSVLLREFSSLMAAQRWERDESFQPRLVKSGTRPCATNFIVEGDYTILEEAYFWNEWQCHEYWKPIPIRFRFRKVGNRTINEWWAGKDIRIVMEGERNLWQNVAAVVGLDAAIESMDLLFTNKDGRLETCVWPDGQILALSTAFIKLIKRFDDYRCMYEYCTMNENTNFYFDTICITVS